MTHRKDLGEYVDWDIIGDTTDDEISCGVMSINEQSQSDKCIEMGLLMNTIIARLVSIINLYLDPIDPPMTRSIWWC